MHGTIAHNSLVTRLFSTGFTMDEALRQWPRLQQYLTNPSQVEWRKYIYEALRRRIETGAYNHNIHAAVYDALEAFRNALCQNLAGGVPDDLVTLVAEVCFEVGVARAVARPPARSSVSQPTDTRVRWLEDLGFRWRDAYVVMPARGDGKCFFHAVANALGMDMMALMRLVIDHMVQPDPHYRQWGAASAIDYVMKSGDLLHDVGGNMFRARPGESPDRFLARWLASGEAWATFTFIMHTIGVLLRRGIGLIILETTHPRVLLTFGSFIQQYILDPWRTGARVARRHTHIRPVTHVLMLAYNGNHYETIAMKCPGARSSGFSSVVEVASMRREGRPWTRLIDTVISDFPEAHRFVAKTGPRGLCSRPSPAKLRSF
jgi:hypothetical protein